MRDREVWRFGGWVWSGGGKIRVEKTEPPLIPSNRYPTDPVVEHAARGINDREMRVTLRWFLKSEGLRKREQGLVERETDSG